MKKLLWIVLVFLSSMSISSETAFAYDFYTNSSDDYYYDYDNTRHYYYDSNEYYYDNYHNNHSNHNNNFNTYNDNSNNYYDKWCSEGYTWPYKYPQLSNWQTYSTRSWNTTVTLLCSNWYVSVTSSSTHSNTYNPPVDNGCKSWKIGTYSYPALSNGATYTTTVWNTTATLICNYWYVSVKSSNTNYPENHNRQPEYTCRANSYASYSYPNMNEGETYANIKDITWWKLTTKLKCVNGYVSVYDSYATCNSGYYVSGKSCIKVQEKTNRNTHNNNYYHWNTSYYYYDDYYYDDYYYDDYYYDDYYYDDYYY